MINLQKITADTWYACTQLDVTKEQKEYFPAPVVYWMAECKYTPDWFEFAIYHDEQLVGFTVYGLDEDNGEYWICALMIDQNYQQHGFGKQAAQKLVTLIREKHQVKKIYIGHRPENKAAAKLYGALGFKETGEIYDGEIFRCLEIEA